MISRAGKNITNKTQIYWYPKYTWIYSISIVTWNDHLNNSHPFASTHQTSTLPLPNLLIHPWDTPTGFPPLHISNFLGGPWTMVYLGSTCPKEQPQVPWECIPYYPCMVCLPTWKPLKNQRNVGKLMSFCSCHWHPEGGSTQRWYA